MIREGEGNERVENRRIFCNDWASAQLTISCGSCLDYRQSRTRQPNAHFGIKNLLARVSRTPGELHSMKTSGDDRIISSRQFGLTTPKYNHR